MKTAGVAMDWLRAPMGFCVIINLLINGEFQTNHSGLVVFSVEVSCVPVSQCVLGPRPVLVRVNKVVTIRLNRSVSISLSASILVFRVNLPGSTAFVCYTTVESLDLGCLLQWDCPDASPNTTYTVQTKTQG